ncbi:MAG: hypothetical protein PHV37_09125 [Candidatus Gastranaerophilales bacterium]|nr:hypothetical protein [Candidatus Gastranaerophilales bacterium]
MVKEKKTNLVERFFSHDLYAREDIKIKRMLYFFRKESEDKAKAAICVFWWIIEDMHKDSYKIAELDMHADDYRCDIEFLKSILEDFELFRIEDDCYVSDRVMRNLEYQTEQADKNSKAAEVRWLLSDFNKAYKDEFGEEPILETEEIEALKKYNGKIKDLRKKFPDILYSLKSLKFDTDINFKPCANWLLAKNNLSRLVNGEFGKLKHRKTAKEIKAEQVAAAEQAAKQAAIENQPSEIDIACETMSSKASAISLVTEKYLLQKDGEVLMAAGGKILINPVARPLMEKFDITEKEILEEARKIYA